MKEPFIKYQTFGGIKEIFWDSLNDNLIYLLHSNLLKWTFKSARKIYPRCMKPFFEFL